MTSPSMIVYLALVVLATSSLVASELSDNELKKVYKEIDSFLAKKLPGEIDNVKLSLNTIVSKLKKEDKWHMFRKKNTNLVQGLKSLLELKNLEESDLCSERAYQIILKNDRATEGRGHTGVNMKKVKRSHIDAIVHHYSVKHAKECFSNHARGFENVHRMMLTGGSKASLEIIEPFLSKVVYRHLCGFVPSHHNMDDCNPDHKTLGSILPKINSFQPADGPVILAELELLTSRKPDEQQHLRRIVSNPNPHSAAELTNLIKRYLLNPCKDYYEGFSEKVFARAQYDDMMLENQIYNESLSDFFLGWANFRLCSAMIKSPNTLSNYVLEYTSRHM